MNYDKSLIKRRHAFIEAYQLEGKLLLHIDRLMRGLTAKGHSTYFTFDNVVSFSGVTGVSCCEKDTIYYECF